MELCDFGDGDGVRETTSTSRRADGYWAFARSLAYYHDESAAHPRDQPVRACARSRAEGHRPHRPRASDRGDLLSLRPLPGIRTPRRCRSARPRRSCPSARPTSSPSRCFPRAFSATRRSISARSRASARRRTSKGARSGSRNGRRPPVSMRAACSQHEYGVDLRQHPVAPGGRARGRPRGESAARPSRRRAHHARAPTRASPRCSPRGELDAVISARDPGGTRLFPDYLDLEREYFRKTRHLSDHARHRAAPGRVRARPLDRDEPVQGVRGGEATEARRASSTSACRTFRCRGWRSTRGAGASWRARTSGPTASSRTGRTLEAFLQYAYEQGVAKRRLEVEELFAPETRESFKI